MLSVPPASHTSREGTLSHSYPDLVVTPLLSTLLSSCSCDQFGSRVISPEQEASLCHQAVCGPQPICNALQWTNGQLLLMVQRCSGSMKPDVDRWPGKESTQSQHRLWACWWPSFGCRLCVQKVFLAWAGHRKMVFFGEGGAHLPRVLQGRLWAPRALKSLPVGTAGFNCFQQQLL